jgi:hypothetical protein
LNNPRFEPLLRARKLPVAVVPDASLWPSMTIPMGGVGASCGLAAGQRVVALRAYTVRELVFVAPAPLAEQALG